MVLSITGNVRKVHLVAPFRFLPLVQFILLDVVHQVPTEFAQPVKLLICIREMPIRISAETPTPLNEVFLSLSRVMP
jgi:hypothetical protein